MCERGKSSICTVTAIALLLQHSGASQVIEQTEDDSVILHPEIAPLRILRPLSNRRAAHLAAAASAADYTDPPPAIDPGDTSTFLSPIPVNAAGFKCEDSALVEAAGTKCSLLAKSVGPLGCQRILAELAAERGRNLDQVPQAFRNRRVADACPHSCGLCSTCAPGCAKWFIGNGWCEPDCNVKSCQWDGGDCWETDCVVSEWGPLSPCSLTCDSTGVGGYQIRSREIKVKNSPGGEKCPSLEEKVVGCNKGIPCPVDCEVSNWSDWSECNEPCGFGLSNRTRDVLVAPAHGAKPCPDLIQRQPCFVAECAVKCVVSNWSPWSPCSKECGSGLQSRTRHITTSPIGDACPSLFEERVCNEQACTRTLGPCKYGPWQPWSECSKECGGGQKTRLRDLLTPGCDVDQSQLVQEATCNDFECVNDCLLSDWSDWSECDVTCGFGSQNRQRKVVTPPSKHGLPCGPTNESRKCLLNACPVACQVSDWSDWSSCTPSSGHCGLGSEIRSRSVTVMPANDGAACPPLSEFRECDKPCPEPECRMSSEWSEWSSCGDNCLEAGGGGPNKREQRSRHRLIDYYSERCTQPTETLEDCSGLCATNENDCLVTTWSEWSPCSEPCGSGVHNRTRAVLRQPGDQGKPCPSLYEEENCGLAMCPSDCITGDWSDWSSCSVQCGTGTQMRSRPIISPPSGLNGKNCGPITQVAPCVGSIGLCGQDCVVSDWSPWQACDRQCGGGSRRRQRQVLQPQLGDGAGCPSLEETETCNTQPCALDCVMSKWSAWSECDGNCATGGDGIQYRERFIIRNATHGGLACDTDIRVETRVCKELLLECDEVCEFGEWASWGPCEGDCGEGLMKRRREVISGARETCVGPTETAPCFVSPCPVDCVTSDWSDWSDCDAPCGGGEVKRARELIAGAANGGKRCGRLWELKSCNEFPCVNQAEDCVMSEWSDWTRCTKSCGGGTHTRTRSISKPPGRGGEPCRGLYEKTGCNLQRCADDKCQDNPRIEAGGITCQIMQTQGCLSNLAELADIHGLELPDDVPPEARVMDACPETCGVCTECSRGCQLRDLGNKVCTQECNNEACEFDRGDCGGDCAIDETILKGALKMVPPVTALKENQRVSVSCPPGHRLRGREALASIALVCQGNPKQLIIEADETDDVRSLVCRSDPCPFVEISGLSGSVALYNGIYSRDVSDQFSSYFRRVGRRELSLSVEESQTNTGVSWTLFETSSDGPLAVLVSPSCSEPSHFGRDTDLSCGDGQWYTENGESLSASPRLACLKVRPPVTAAVLDSEGRGVITRIPTGPGASMPLQCEDIKLVESVSGFTCQKMREGVGCDYRLVETGKELPAFLPSDAVVASVCPRTCGQCEQCAPGCAIWFLGNGYCDVTCNNEACGFDDGDCEPTAYDRLLEPSEMSATLEVDPSTAANHYRGIDKDNCADDPLVAQAGFSCQLLLMASELPNVGGCEATLLHLAEVQGTTIELPSGVPEDIRILDACPLACNACDKERLLRRSTTTEAASTSAAELDGCSDSDLVEQIAKLSCSEIVHILGDCSMTLKELGYLPDGMSDTVNIGSLCPMSCKVCHNPKAPKYQCHDYTILQEMSGFSCAQAVGLLGPATCAKALSSFGYELPSALPASLTLSDLCGVSCDTCGEETGDDGSLTERADSPLEGCRDADFIYDLTGFECPSFVEQEGVKCSDSLHSMGYTLPENVPLTATVSQACARSCNACPVVAQGICEDSAVVVNDFGTTCSALITSDSCAQLLTSSSVVPSRLVSSSLYLGLRVSDVCRESCGLCSQPDLSRACQDHPAVSASGYSCQLFLQFAPNGCTTPLVDLLGRTALLPQGVPKSTLIQDACPKTCNICSDNASQVAVCEDSPLLNAVNLSCSQVIAMAGGGGAGCSATVDSLAGSASFSALLPAGTKVNNLCKRSCMLCDAPSCDDGYQNGDESEVDCGGSQCRPCRSCSVRDLKKLPAGTTSAPIGAESFESGSRRMIVCSDDYYMTSGSDTIVCRDGRWMTPKNACVEASLPVWRLTYGLTRAEDFDFSIVKPIVKSVDTVLRYVYSDLPSDNVRIASAGSCAAIAASNAASSDPDSCEDNPLVAETGFGCEMVAALGCNLVLAELAATAGASLPPGIPVDTLVSDACPKTCDTCAEAAARAAEFMAASSSTGNTLGSDCFKADLMIRLEDSSRSLPDDLQRSFGTVESIQRIFLAALRDSADGVSLYTTWLPRGEVSKTKSSQDAPTFISERPVDLQLLKPESNSGGVDFSLSDPSAASSETATTLPASNENVTLSVWNAAVTSASPVSASRDIFKSLGISPGLQYPMTKEMLMQRLTPELLKSQPTAAEMKGHYFGEDVYGSILSSRISGLEECALDDQEGVCCDLRDAVQQFLDGPCGAVIYAQAPTSADMDAFCSVKAGSHSCLQEGYGLVFPYRSLSSPSCAAVDLLLNLLGSWCRRSPTDNSYCLLDMIADIKKVSSDPLNFQLTPEFDAICHPESCLRSHFTYLNAVAELSAGWSLASMSSEARRRRRLGVSHLPLIGLQRNLSETLPQLARHVTPRLLSEVTSSGVNFVIPLDRLGDDLLSLLCFKVDGDYCPQTVELLAQDNPVSSPLLVTSPCSSKCFAPVTQRVGEIIRAQGRDLASPQHLALGSALTYFGKYACKTNEAGKPCSFDQRYSGSLTLPQRFNLTSPAYKTDKCRSCDVTFIGDGQCDRECFTPDCGFDMADCTPWTSFPDFTSTLLQTLCVESISDPCLPLHKDFDCLNSKCRTRLTQCLDKNGCCYTAALQILREMIAGYDDLQSTIFATFGQGDQITARITDAFNLDATIQTIELACNAALDRTCSKGKERRLSRTTAIIDNISPTSTQRQLGAVSPYRRMSKAPVRALPVADDIVNAQILRLNNWLALPAQRETVAGQCHVMPQDISKLTLTQLEMSRLAFLLELDAGDTDTPSPSMNETSILRLLFSAPGYESYIVNTSRPVEVHVPSVSSVATKSPTASFGRPTVDKTQTSKSAPDGCVSNSLWPLVRKGVIFGATAATSDSVVSAHGTQVTTTCASGYIAEGGGITSSGTFQCYDGFWLPLVSLKCQQPCGVGPLEALGLSDARVQVIGVSGRNESKLFDPKISAKQISELNAGDRYPPETSVVLACTDSHSVNVTNQVWGIQYSICQDGHWTPTTLDCQPDCPSIPSFARSEPEAYQLGSLSTVSYGSSRDMKCADGYFATPPTFEGISEAVTCLTDGEWSQLSFRCVAGLTINPTGGPGTVQKMLKTLFSRTGVLSLVIFGIAIVIIVVGIAIFWNVFYRTRADLAYAERKKLLQEYLASTMTAATETIEKGASQAFPVDGTGGEGETWVGRSPSSSTVSAVRRFVMLAGTRAPGSPTQ